MRSDISYLVIHKFRTVNFEKTPSQNTGLRVDGLRGLADIYETKLCRKFQVNQILPSEIIV